MVLNTARKQSTSSEYVVHSFDHTQYYTCLRKLIRYAKYLRTDFSVDSQKTSPVNNGIFLVPYHKCKIFMRSNLFDKLTQDILYLAWATSSAEFHTGILFSKLYLTITLIMLYI